MYLTRSVDYLIVELPRTLQYNNIVQPQYSKGKTRGTWGVLVVRDIHAWRSAPLSSLRSISATIYFELFCPSNIISSELKMLYHWVFLWQTICFKTALKFRQHREHSQLALNINDACSEHDYLALNSIDACRFTLLVRNTITSHWTSLTHAYSR